MPINSTSYSLQLNYKIKTEYLFFMVFLLLLFSHDYHFLWLVYDFLAVWCVLRVIKYRYKPTTLIAFIVFSTFVGFSILLNGAHVISILSVWDNFKHLFIFGYLVQVINMLSVDRLLIFSKRIYIYLTILFFIQFAIVMYQVQSGRLIDDVSGSFGTGASHAIGYFCLMYIMALYMLGRPKLFYFISVVIISTVINYYAENVGFFILLAFLVFYLNPKYALYSVVAVAVLLLGFEDLRLFFDEIFISRVHKFFMYMDSDTLDFDNVVDRSTMTLYAFKLGGMLGAGLGSYSDIYNMTGWKYDDIVNHQVTISTFTTLLSEYGVMGAIIVYLIYIRYFHVAFYNRKNAYFSILLFTLAFLYNRVLNDERIIFQLILIFSFIKISENTRISSR